MEGLHPFYQQFTFKSLHLGNQNSIGVATFRDPVPPFFPRTAIVKICLRSDGTEIREINVTKQVQNKDRHIVQMYAYFLSKRGTVMMLEHCERGSLLDLLWQHYRDERTIIPWLHQLARAVHALHSMKIGHRDIKPGNVFVTHDYELRLGDFGEAVFVACDSETRVRGTVAYMPEKLKAMLFRREVHKSVSLPHDIWSLGRTFYEICMGEIDEAFTDQTEDMHKLLNRVEYQMRQRGVPDPIVRLVGAMLSVEVRVLTSAEVLQTVEELLHAQAPANRLSFPSFGSLPLEFSSARSPIERCQFDSDHSGPFTRLKCDHMYCRRCLLANYPDALDLAACACPICKPEYTHCSIRLSRK